MALWDAIWCIENFSVYAQSFMHAPLYVLACASFCLVNAFQQPILYVCFTNRSFIMIKEELAKYKAMAQKAPTNLS